MVNQTHDITTPTGAVVKLAAASWEDSNNLKSIIQSEFSDANIDLDLNNLDGDSDIFKSMGLIKIIMKIDSSKQYQEYLFKCLAKSTYNGDRITTSTFEPLEARQDYYQVMMECLKLNIAPFFQGLVSQFTEMFGGMKDKTSQE